MATQLRTHWSQGNPLRGDMEDAGPPDLNLDKHFLRTALWPAVAYTTILMLVGTVGNVIVLIIYRRQLRVSVTRLFIFSLAVLDLGNCLITMPAELMILVHFTSFPSTGWCKASRYLTYTFNGTSSIILIAIALERYFKVCRPTSTYISMARARQVCIGALLIAGAMSAPSLILYGDMTLPILVSGHQVSILPPDNQQVNSSTKHFTYWGSHVSPSSLTVDSSQLKDYPGKSTDSLKEMSRQRAIKVYGTFCLLKSESMDSPLSLLFYTSMFATYLLMVILVVFFYGKVARAMFVLKSRHCRLFSMNNSNTTSVCGSGHDQSPGLSQQDNSDVQTSDSKGNNFPGQGDNSSVSNGLEKSLQGLNQENILDGGNNGEVTHMSKSSEAVTSPESHTDTDSESFTRIAGKEGKCLPLTQNNSREPDSSDAKHDRIDTTRGDVDRLDSRHHDNIFDNETVPKHEVNTLDKSQNETPAEHIENLIGNNTKARGPKHSNKTKSPKLSLPTIKVQDVSSKYDPGLERKSRLSCDMKASLYSLSSNTLLQRRIKSVESIRSLSHLSKLDIPSRRVSGYSLPDKRRSDHLLKDISGHSLSDKDLPGKLRVMSKRLRRENTTELGNMSKSCVSLDVVDAAMGEIDPTAHVEKTLTLTRTCPQGRKRLCVLPLTGMSTKTATFLHDTHKGSGHSVASCGSLNERGAASGGAPERLFSPEDEDSVITLRQNTPAPCVKFKECDKEDADRRKRGAGPARNTIVSMADALHDRHRRGSLHPHRTSRMLFIISLVFVVSFLPFFIIVLIRSSVGVTFMTSLSDAGLCMVSLFIRSSLISNAVNPLIYGLLSTQFRRECTGLVCCLLKT